MSLNSGPKKTNGHTNGQNGFMTEQYMKEELEELVGQVKIWRKLCKDAAQKLGEMNDIFREKGVRS